MLLEVGALFLYRHLTLFRCQALGQHQGQVKNKTDFPVSLLSRAMHFALITLVKISILFYVHPFHQMISVQREQVRITHLCLLRFWLERGVLKYMYLITLSWFLGLKAKIQLGKRSYL